MSNWKLRGDTRDPLYVLIEREERTCKGCVHSVETRLWGVDYKVCALTRKKPVKKCSLYKDVE